ncbi:MAG: serine/threonine protein kinase, partial [Pyrinomonadaceae bacterium]|nr:serine/threonine protein kinase [Phycisphaerales bacterium]
MKVQDERDRFLKLDSLFAEVIDLSVADRDGFLRSVDGSDPELAPAIRELVRAHERSIPALDHSPIPSIEPMGGEFTMINTLLGDWRITRHIGRGGWADVYEAVQSAPARTCALKVLRWPWLCTPRMLRRFRDEAELLARVEHPGIARIYGAGVARVKGVDLPYLALELVPDATPITDRATSQGLTIDRRLGLFCEVCDAVHSAHLRGVLHRDLKPTNILIGSDGRPRVIDFGVAYAMDHAGVGLTSTGEFIGTVGYMSPERLAGGRKQGGNVDNQVAGGECGQPPDARWDVYSLGVILYELVVRSHPYKLSDNFAAAVAVVQQSTPIPPIALDPSLPRDLCTIIETAIEKDPSRRYQSVADLGADLRRFLTSCPIMARPTPLHHRLRLAVRRRPGMAAAIGCSFLGAVAVLATAVNGWQATQRELRGSEQTLDIFDAALATVRSRRSGDDVLLPDLLEALKRPLTDANLSPRVAARTHEMVGRTYEDLADYDAAFQHYTAGLAAAKAVWDVDDPIVVRLEIELAGAMYDRGDPVGAAGSLESLLNRTPDLAPALLAKIKNDLAVAYMKAENWQEAERVGLDAYALRWQQLGKDAPETIQSLTNLGANAMRLGKHQVASERLAEAVKRLEPLGSDGSRLRVHAKSYLVLCLGRLGDHEGSKALCREVQDELTRTVGVDHPLFAKLSMVWADAALARGELDAAIT